MATLELEKAAEDLVELRITGMRKGTDEPAYLHSFRTSQMLRERGYSGEVCLAGLLHDVIEDGGVAYRELKKAGFSKRVIAIVKLVSHDPRFKNHDARWTMMVAGLIRARDPEAWAVKLADAYDNVRGSSTMEPDRAKFFREVKAPLTLAVSEDLMGETELWNMLKELVLSEQAERRSSTPRFPSIRQGLSTVEGRLEEVTAAEIPAEDPERGRGTKKSNGKRRPGVI